MLVLSRRKDQKVLFPNMGISVQVVAISGQTVRLGIDAPDNVRIARDEIECFEACRVSGSPDGEDGMEQIRRQLDAANLAIHLACNQLQQGKTGMATDAVSHAIACLRSLDLMLESKESFAPAGDNSLAVRESRPGYQIPATNPETPVPEPAVAWSAAGFDLDVLAC